MESKRIFLRTFNNKINSRSGAQLPLGQYRGTPEWLEFQKLLIECLEWLGHDVRIQVENPNIPDEDGFKLSDKYVYVHQNKKDNPKVDLTWMQMHHRDLFTIDTNGWGVEHSGLTYADSFMYENDYDSRDFCEKLSDEMHSSGVSKCKQDEITDSTPDSFILVPIQIPRDYTIQNYSPITVKYFIDSIQAWAIENRYHVCFKMHPHNSGDHDLHKAVDEATVSRYVHKVKGNIHELIKRSVGLFVINSGTGFEGLIHGKPVATLGLCDYSRATFNADIRRLDEARTHLYSYRPEYRDIAYKFVHWYFFKHAYYLKDVNVKARLTSYLKGVLC